MAEKCTGLDAVQNPSENISKNDLRIILKSLICDIKDVRPENIVKDNATGRNYLIDFQTPNQAAGICTLSNVLNGMGNPRMGNRRITVGGDGYSVVIENGRSKLGTIPTYKFFKGSNSFAKNIMELFLFTQSVNKELNSTVDPSAINEGGRSIMLNIINSIVLVENIDEIIINEINRISIEMVKMIDRGDCNRELLKNNLNNILTINKISAEHFGREIISDRRLLENIHARLGIEIDIPQPQTRIMPREQRVENTSTRAAVPIERPQRKEYAQNRPATPPTPRFEYPQPSEVSLSKSAPNVSQKEILDMTVEELQELETRQLDEELILCEKNKTPEARKEKIKLIRAKANRERRKEEEEDLANRLEELNTRVSSLYEDLDKLEKLKDEYSKKINKLKTKAASLKDEYALLSENIEEIEFTVAGFDRRIARNIESYEEKYMESQKISISTLRREIRSQEDKYEDKKEKLVELKQRLKDIREGLYEFNDQDHMVNYKERLKKRISKISYELEKFEHGKRILELEAKKRKEAANLEQQLKERDGVVEEINKCGRNISYSKENIDNIKEQINNTEYEIANVEREKKRIEQQIESRTGFASRINKSRSVMEMY